MSKTKQDWLDQFEKKARFVDERLTKEAISFLSDYVSQDLDQAIQAESRIKDIECEEAMNIVKKVETEAERERCIWILEGMKFKDVDYPNPPDTTNTEVLSDFLGKRDGLSRWNLALDTAIEKIKEAQ